MLSGSGSYDGESSASANLLMVYRASRWLCAVEQFDVSKTDKADIDNRSLSLSGDELME